MRSFNNDKYTKEGEHGIRNFRAICFIMVKFAKMKTMNISTPWLKVWLWLPLSCLIGFIVGSWGAKEELRAYQESVKEERNRSAKKAGGFDTFANLVKIPEMTRRPRKAKRPARNRKDAQVTNASAAVAKSQGSSLSAATNTSAAVRKTPPRRSVEDLGVRIEEAQELWRTRVDVARAQWKERLKLSGEKEQAFDAALQDMNERLYDSIAAVAELIAESDTMSPELGLRLVGETTAIMAETYDKIGACVPAEMRSHVSSMQMVDFVDPGVAEPLIGVQGKVENIGHRAERKR